MKSRNNIGVNALAQSLKKIFSSTKKSGKDNFINKTYKGTDDNFFDEANKHLHAALTLGKKGESYRQFEARYLLEPPL